ncbi:hypothetical protein CASFOL_005593 [Castilleja foliolosa]|uniref:Uncharacterized protein n=1 Tax=Castilleja foliolosa TaxID=1961234 RepID=A0ABD3E3V7_9LAMI
MPFHRRPYTLPLVLARVRPHHFGMKQHLLDQHRLLHPGHPKFPARPADSPRIVHQLFGTECQALYRRCRGD